MTATPSAAPSTTPRCNAWSGRWARRERNRDDQPRRPLRITGYARGPAFLAAALDAIGERARALFAWDAAEQRYRVTRRGAPAFLNDLEGLERGQGFWGLIEGAAPLRWERTARAAATTVLLVPGLTFVAWLGPDGFATSEAGVRVRQVFGFDAAAQRFLAFRPTVPTILNALATLTIGAGLWVEMDTAAEWLRPSPES